MKNQKTTGTKKFKLRKIETIDIGLNKSLCISPKCIKHILIRKAYLKRKKQ